MDLLAKSRTLLKDPQLGAELEKGLLTSFNEIWASSKDENLYVFGIYTNDDYTSVDVAANTIEALKDKAREYQQSKRYGTVPLDKLEAQLKWDSIGDWKYIGSSSPEKFLSTNNLLQEIAGISDELLDSAVDTDEALDLVDDQITKELINLFISSLNKFREREPRLRDITTGIWTGDQSEEEMIYFVSQLNDPEQTQKFISELRMTGKSLG